MMTGLPIAIASRMVVTGLKIDVVQRHDHMAERAYSERSAK
jgi:hypothetical protein